MADTKAVAKELSPVEQLKRVLSAESVQEQLKNALKEEAPLFVASIIDVYSNDAYLQDCKPSDVVREALKAATLKLPINKNLGFAWIIPYKEKGVPKPQFQMGYKGYIQLAMRTGQYRYINADAVYEGEIVYRDKLTGEIRLEDSDSDEVVGYFALMETINGFRKTIYWTKDQMLRHAQKYSKSYHRENSVWKTDFEAMAIKTMIKALLSKYGIMSVEMMNAFTSDTADDVPFEDQVQGEIEQNANSEVLDIEAEDPEEEGPEF